MKNPRVLLICLISFLFLFNSCVSKKSFNKLSSEKELLSLEMLQLRKEFERKIETVSKENESLAQKNGDLNDSIGNLNVKVNDAEKNIYAVRENLKNSKKELSKFKTEVAVSFEDITSAVSAQNLRLKNMENYIYLDMSRAVTFESGSSLFSKKDVNLLDSIATILLSNPSLTLVVEGHTDARSITNSKYKDNWDLSVARATNVVRKLVQLGAPARQLIAAGRADNVAAVIEDPANKSTLEANRRIEFMVLPNIGNLYRISK